MFTRTLRLRITPDRIAGVIDADTGKAPEFWSGSPAALRLAFFAGPAADALRADFSDLLAVELQLKAAGSGGIAPPDTAVPLVSSTTDDFDAALTLADWNAGTGAHCEITLTGAQLNRARGKLWAVLVAHRISSTEPLTLAAGPITLAGDGYAPDAGDPPPAVPAYPAPAVMNQMVDDIVALKAEDLLLAEGIAEEAAARAAADAGKVDKAPDKGLSANDYTDAEKAKLAGITGVNTGDQDISGIATNAAAIALLESGKAPLASPALTGVPTAPTAAPGTATTQLANTAFVQAALDALVAGAPGALDTLAELAAAMGADPNFATTVINALATKALRATSPTAGHLAKLDDAGNPVDTGVSADDGLILETDTVARRRAKRRSLGWSQKGGVVRSAASYFNSTVGESTGDYTVSISVGGMSALGPLLLTGAGGGAAVRLYANATSVYLDCSGGGSAPSETIQALAEFRLTLVRTGRRAFKVYRDEVEVIDFTATADTSITLPMPTDVPNYAHTLGEHIYLNAALTSDQINSLVLDDIPVELARLGSSGMSWTNGVGAYAAWSSFTSTGADNLSVSASAGTNAACIIQLPFSKVGQYIRIKGVVAAQSGMINLAGTDSSANGMADDVWSDLSGCVSIGANPWDLRITGTGPFSARIYVPAQARAITVGNLEVSAFVTIIGMTVTAEGIVEHFPSDAVSSAGNWRGVFGTLLVAGTGITPIASEPRRVRREKVRYNLATQTAADPIPTGWTLNYISTGVLKITPPAWARAIDRPLISAVTDGDSFVSSDYETDTTDIYLRCKTVGAAPAPVDARLRISLEHRE